MELGSIWLGGFKLGVLDCPPGTPEPKEFTKPTPALLTRAVKKRTKGEKRELVAAKEGKRLGLESV